MKKRTLSILLSVGMMAGLFVIPVKAVEETRYNFSTNFNSKADMISAIDDNDGSSWQTVTPKIEESGGHDGGKYVQYAFTTKANQDVTKNGSYGFRLPTWSKPSGTYTNNPDGWKPDGETAADLVTAIADGEAVSVWLKTDVADGFTRKIKMKFETRTASAKVGDYTTGSIELANDGEWHLLRVPLSEFKRNSKAINAPDELNAETNIPAKFYLMVNYRDFANITDGAAHGGGQTEKIAMDDFMIERQMAGGSQPIAGLNYDEGYIKTARLTELSFNGNAAQVAETIRLEYPSGVTSAQLAGMLEFSVENPLLLTDTEKGQQYKNGATASFTPPESLPGSGKVTVVSGDGTVSKEYTLEFVQGSGEVTVITKRYNYLTHCEETNDRIGGLANVGGGWSTVGGSSGKLTKGGIDGSNALRVTFKTKASGGSLTEECSYGFRFITWLSDSNYTGDIWQPEEGVTASLSEALADTQAVSLWIKVPAASFSRKAALSIECKPAGGSTVYYKTEPLDLISDDEFHLYQIPMSSFRSAGQAFSELTQAELEELRPYKFAFATNYRNFLQVEEIPESEEEVYIHFDDVMFERKVDLEANCPYPVAVPLSAKAEYGKDAELTALTLGDFSSSVDGTSVALQYPQGMQMAQLNLYTLKGSSVHPVVLTNPKQGVQYTNGTVITNIKGTLEKAEVTVHSGDYSVQKTYQVSLIPSEIDETVVLAGVLGSEYGKYYVVSPQSVDFDLIVSVYKDGILQEAVTEQKKAVTGGTSLAISLPDSAKDGQVSMFLWDLQTLRPYTEPIR